MRFDAPGNVTQRVRSSIRATTSAGSSRPVVGSNGARTCSAPDCSHARRHGVTLASWSRRVPTTRSPGRSVDATVRLNASVSVVMLAPKTMPAGWPPSSVATRPRARSSRASQASAAANEPPVLALLPLAAHVAMASMATSTICVPAGPSKRAHPSRTPGNRARIVASLMLGSLPAISSSECFVHRSVWCGGHPQRTLRWIRPRRAASQAVARSAAAAARARRKWSAPSMTSTVVSGQSSTIGSTADGGENWSNAGTRTSVGSGDAGATSITASGGAMATRAVTAGWSTPRPTAAPNE